MGSCSGRNYIGAHAIEFCIPRLRRTDIDSKKCVKTSTNWTFGVLGSQ